MRTETIKIYQYQELDSSAQARARDYFAINMEYPWFNESIDSVKCFCDLFGVKIEDHRIDPEDYRGSFIKTNADNSNFRGFTLKDAKKLLDTNGNGYCIYFDLVGYFIEEMQVKGSALAGFKDALNRIICVIEADIEYQYSREAIEEMIEANEYEFLEAGDLH